MYIPPSFEVKDQSALFEFVEGHSFGLLISDHSGEPFATHLPFLLDRSVGPHGRLIGHVAKANPHWRYADGKSVLCVFSGPHAYISPTWYQSEEVVPTWNYVAVHAYGTLHAIHEEAELLKIVGDSVRRFEATLPDPWIFNGTDDFNSRLLKGIVGFQIDVVRLEGKWKLNQNHPVARRQKVAEALEASSNADAQAIARMIKDGLAP